MNTMLAILRVTDARRDVILAGGLFTCDNWSIGYKFGTNHRAESNFGTHKELIVLNILKYKYCVNKSRDVSRDHLF